jgi:hypothetical protein
MDLLKNKKIIIISSIILVVFAVVFVFKDKIKNSSPNSSGNSSGNVITAPAYIVTIAEVTATPPIEPISQEQADKNAKAEADAGAAASEAARIVAETERKAKEAEKNLEDVKTSAEAVLALAETAAQIEAAEKLAEDVAALEAAYDLLVSSAHAATIASIKANDALLQAYISDQEITLENVNLAQKACKSETDVYISQANNITVTTPSQFNAVISNISTNNTLPAQASLTSINLYLNQINGILTLSKNTYNDLINENNIRMDIQAQKSINDSRNCAAAGGSVYNIDCSRYQGLSGANATRPPVGKSRVDTLKSNTERAEQIKIDALTTKDIANKIISTFDTNISQLKGFIVSLNGSLGPPPTDLSKASTNKGYLNDNINRSLSAASYLQTIKTNITSINSLNVTIKSLVDSIKLNTSSDLIEAGIIYDQLTNAVNISEFTLKSATEVETAVQKLLDSYQCSKCIQPLDINTQSTSINTLYNKYKIALSTKTDTTNLLTSIETAYNNITTILGGTGSQDITNIYGLYYRGNGKYMQTIMGSKF